MPEITVIARNGVATLVALDGTAQSLMHLLRECADLDVAGDCGGCCVCGTCHIWVEETDLAALPRATEEERELTENFLNADRRSRLACQIDIATVPQGATITIAPKE